MRDFISLFLLSWQGLLFERAQVAREREQFQIDLPSQTTLFTKTRQKFYLFSETTLQQYV